MKLDETKNELKQLNLEALQEKVDGWRRDLFTLRINASTSHVKDYSQFAKLRKNIARAMTYIHQKQKMA